MSAQSAAPADDAPHLLVVDDDRRIRVLLSRFLTGEGYRISTANTAAEARAMLAGLSFDLLILDVMMPGETGFKLAESIRKTSSVPILMLTARDEKASRIEGLEIGADDYVAQAVRTARAFASYRQYSQARQAAVGAVPPNRSASAPTCFISPAPNCAAARRSSISPTASARC